MEVGAADLDHLHPLDGLAPDRVDQLAQLRQRLLTILNSVAMRIAVGNMSLED